ncbi:hypothetical protein SAMN04488074_11152 [Lentzea albidocapillata subsp. violacea]|uniref:WD40-like Beta Propeller Repeat n=1 Tax=Lentzea albidocapillata subsp. violacea TaxID=128104 RepID=A0A1G9K8A8_9PSEU|nr:hypothetical protein [Lentzea albidocapillata]SDL45503.1 hypothetical protein SAMN04488074_11152 [Lentzea albidocapillata subsp. violacea]
MRALIALAGVTAVAGCVAAYPIDRPSDYTAESRLSTCRVDLPQSWKDLLSRDRTEAGPHEKVIVVAANEDAGTTLVKTTRNRTTELVLHDHGKRQQVMAVQNDGQLFGVEFDGRWVTFSTTPNPADHTTTTYAWDSRDDGAPVRIGDDGAVVHNGKAAWSDSAGVHLYDLAKKKDRVVGPGTKPAFLGDAVIWLQDGKFRAEGALPEQLQNAEPGDSVASDGRTVVWTRDEKLIGWREGWAQPRELAGIRPAPRTEGIVFPRVSGDFVSWQSESSYVTDIRSGATLHTTEGGYWLEVHGGALTRQGWRVAAAAPLAKLSPLSRC